MEAKNKKALIGQLRQDILKMEGFKPQSAGEANLGLGCLEKAFPYGIFPTKAIHEFLCEQEEQVASCNGFIATLLGVLMQDPKLCVWISPFPQVFPPSLQTFGIAPDRIIFIQLHKDRDILWAMEESLKCKGLIAVVAELQDLSFAQSRRLQLAVENGNTTGFVLRRDSRKVNTTACIARWRISPLPSILENGVPGVGFPHWKVELLKAKNGKPDIWTLIASPNGLQINRETEKQIIPLKHSTIPIKTGS